MEKILSFESTLLGFVIAIHSIDKSGNDKPLTDELGNREFGTYKLMGSIITVILPVLTQKMVFHK